MRVRGRTPWQGEMDNRVMAAAETGVPADMEDNNRAGRQGVAADKVWIAVAQKAREQGWKPVEVAAPRLLKEPGPVPDQAVAGAKVALRPPFVGVVSFFHGEVWVFHHQPLVP